MTGDNRSYILEYFIKNSNKDFMRTIDDVYQKLYASEVNEILGDKKRLKKSEQRNKIFGHIQSLLDEGILCCDSETSADMQRYMDAVEIAKKNKKSKVANKNKTKEEKKQKEETKHPRKGWNSWHFYYNQPLEIKQLKNFAQYIMQVSNIEDEDKVELIEGLGKCCGQNLSHQFMEDFKTSNLDYILTKERVDSDESFGKRHLLEVGGRKWKLLEDVGITYDSIEIQKTVDVIQTLICQRRKILKFEIINFTSEGERESIRNKMIYECIPLYLITAGNRIWMVSKYRDKKQTELCFYPNYNYTPVDVIKLCEIQDGEYINETLHREITGDFDKLKRDFESKKIREYISYETPEYIELSVLYNERMGRIPWDFIYRNFGENYYILEDSGHKTGKVNGGTTSKTDGVKILVRKSPYLVIQLAVENPDSIRIDKFYDSNGKEDCESMDRLREICENLRKMYL